MNDTDASDIKAESDSVPEPVEKKGLKVLFLSSDTGGGHRASAESLARQFQLLYPGSTYDLLDVVEKDGVPPYNSLVGYYKHLSSHPAQWKLVYSVSNSRAFEMLADAHLKLMCERAVRRRIKGYDPDVVVSVHPLMCNVPVLSCKKISAETGKNLPMFTVVTDLGSAHCLWFANGVEKMFVGSDQIQELAKNRGKVPEEKLVKIGLPIRHDFAEQSEKLGDRMSTEGKAYQRSIQKELELPLTEGDFKTILVMGGGEGVGSLANIVDALYCELVSQGIDSQVLVVCGRNDKLKKSIDERNWNEVIASWVRAKDRKNKTPRFRIRDCVSAENSSVSNVGCVDTSSYVGSSLRRILSSSSIGAAVSIPLPRSNSHEATSEEEEKKCDNAGNEAEGSSIEIDANGQMLDAGLSGSGSGKSSPVAIPGQSSIDLSECNGNHFPGQVKVVGLGFVTKMAEYMVAADVLVSKAGPGTIVEAAALSLPVMLTSYLPGQEEGNVDFVVDNEFGAFCSDRDPNGIAEELCMWLLDDEKMATLSKAAKKIGAPDAARDIAKEIGDRALKWREINEKNAVVVSEEDETADNDDQ
ncbi:Monogalactosyldiacylglycerol synthase 2, chloroplastic [Seminavis robusta]|uniref:monogalactosyldiacylglycerol synthase n=1 Tax=Seminavis robusta TaxID=568900 RepID=A0A9N8EIR6_9STRA|nr:Monogalactosyldiacylglycerol synthase 2, chloroplastic [Seminavis robusta]|eukprot:Sro1298_g260560.1 Monogalactosyldiacylglycerol synthase 2, chloroplastic (584) ;mRNA; f:1198-2949